MKLQLSPPVHSLITVEVPITGSKSETNRLLLLQALYPNIRIENLSNSDDARVMEEGLKAVSGTVDIHHAGTAMRFLTAFYAAREGTDVVLTGSKRMTERPIGVLVEALKGLGADIAYLNKTGYPPLRIRGKKLSESRVQLQANVSSQYISALLLVAGTLENGLELDLLGEITSVPYIKMTLGLLGRLGIKSEFAGQKVRVFQAPKVEDDTLVVESDWSSASYFYSIAAMSDAGSELELSSYRKGSLQGDSVLKEIYKDFRVETSFDGKGIILRKLTGDLPKRVEYNLANAPDIAQTLAVSCFGLGMGCHLTGLHTLKIKETDRLVAMQRELGKLGAVVGVTDRALTLEPATHFTEGVAIDTYHDHRMAMAFGPLAMKVGLLINDAGVVSKSYPDYWEDLKKVGFKVSVVP